MSPKVTIKITWMLHLLRHSDGSTVRHHKQKSYRDSFRASLSFSSTLRFFLRFPDKRQACICLATIYLGTKLHDWLLCGPRSWKSAHVCGALLWRTRQRRLSVSCQALRLCGSKSPSRRRVGSGLRGGELSDLLNQSTNAFIHLQSSAINFSAGVRTFGEIWPVIASQSRACSFSHLNHKTDIEN